MTRGWREGRICQTRAQRDEIVELYLRDPQAATQLAVSRGLSPKYAMQLAIDRGVLTPRRDRRREA